jgi:hypothetical protein
LEDDKVRVYVPTQFQHGPLERSILPQRYTGL